MRQSKIAELQKDLDRIQAEIKKLSIEKRFRHPDFNPEFIPTRLRHLPGPGIAEEICAIYEKQEREAKQEREK